LVHLAEDSDRQQSARRKTFYDGLIKTSIPEEVADDDIDWRPFGETGVEIHDFESTAVVHPVTGRQVTGESYCDGRDVDSIDSESSYGEPNGCESSSTRKIDCMTTCRKQVLDRGKQSWRTEDRPATKSLDGVLLIPTKTILFGHSFNPRSRLNGPPRRGIPTPQRNWT
jgi:hypothetical protein